MNGEFGNLLIDVFDKGEGEKFIREGNDLHCIINVPVVDAILGCDVTVETINGKKLKAKIPAGTEDGYTMRFAGYGMPIYGRNQYGDMYGEVKIKMPKTITNEEKMVLENLKTKKNFK
jgi:molecular chaperone DnaJ